MENHDAPQPLNYATPQRRSPLKLLTTLLPFTPLLLAIFTIPWGAFVGLLAWYNIGDFEPTRAQSFFIDAFSLIPPAIGLLFGILLLLRSRRLSPLPKIFAAIGSLACAVLICVYTWQSIQWHIKFGYGTSK